MQGRSQPFHPPQTLWQDLEYEHAEGLRLDVLRTSKLLTEEERSAYLRILREKDSFSDIADSLRMLCFLLERHYGQKVILLLDEYDVPLDKAYQHGYCSQMIDLIRALFGAALKTNDSLFFAVLTGCLRVSKESIFTGLNNLMIHSISDANLELYHLPGSICRTKLLPHLPGAANRKRIC